MITEELGHDNEWGRPELTKKMLAVTPGQRIEILTQGGATKEWEFEMKREFLKRLRGESLEEGVLSNFSAAVKRGIKNVSHKFDVAGTQKSHYDAWKRSESQEKQEKAKKEKHRVL